MTLDLANYSWKHFSPANPNRRYNLSQYGTSNQPTIQILWISYSIPYLPKYVHQKDPELMEYLSSFIGQTKKPKFCYL